MAPSSGKSGPDEGGPPFAYPGEALLTLIRNKELRVVSSREGRPYAMTSIMLSGQVIVQLDRGFWMHTPATTRAADLEEHARLVATRMEGLAASRMVLNRLILAMRGVFAAAGTATLMKSALAAPAVSPVVILSVAGVILSFVPRRWIVGAFVTVLRPYLRRRLRMG